MKQPLTKTQVQTLDFVIKFFKKHRYMPTHEELAKQFKLVSGGTTKGRFLSLEKKGYIKRIKYRARMIKLI